MPKKIANYLGLDYSKMNLTHTGGNLMQDGRGTSFSDDLVVSEDSAVTYCLSFSKQEQADDESVHERVCLKSGSVDKNIEKCTRKIKKVYTKMV